MNIRGENSPDFGDITILQQRDVNSIECVIHVYLGSLQRAISQALIRRNASVRLLG